MVKSDYIVWVKDEHSKWHILPPNVPGHLLTRFEDGRIGITWEVTDMSALANEKRHAIFNKPNLPWGRDEGGPTTMKLPLIWDKL